MRIDVLKVGVKLVPVLWSSSAMDLIVAPSGRIPLSKLVKVIIVIVVVVSIVVEVVTTIRIGGHRMVLFDVPHPGRILSGSWKIFTFSTESLAISVVPNRTANDRLGISKATRRLPKLV